MKKILTLLTFVFMTSAMLFGQCPDYRATPGGTNKLFNMEWVMEADKNAVWNDADLESITFPAFAGGTIDIPKGDLQDRGGVGTPVVAYRIRANESNNTFGGTVGNFTGSITFNYTVASGKASVTCNYTNNVLPVELISFDGVKKDNQINLSWETASEINNEGFEIQKSTDGIVWDMIDFVAGNGTTQEYQSYSFTDQRPEEGNNYYRLKQMDFDGEFEYSKVVSVDFNNELNEVGMFPNPANDQLTLINGEGEATIYNILGKPVKQLTIDADQATIQLADLLNGQYYLQLIQENGKIVTKQFSKVN